jgi:uncharacterized protein involved in type VI secretion and phage assembly
MSLMDVMQDRHEKAGKVNLINGVVAGTVTNNKDPNGQARVKVNLGHLGDGGESDWAKVMSFTAGKGRGAVFLPEVGDEVLVAFEQGDVNHPYVLGALWNSQDTPPETNGNGQNNIRTFKSRSGHQITFDDTAGGEKIVIQDKSGSNLITIDSVKGEMTLESQTSLKIKSQQIEIQAQGQIKFSASGTVDITGSMVNINS